MTMAETTSTRTKTELKPLEVGVGAGAAVITAFASSYLGTAGTLTGAALASIVATVSTSVLRSSVHRTNESLLRTTARLRQGTLGPELGGGATGGATAVDPGVAAVDEAELAAIQPDEPEPPTATMLTRRRRPKWAVLTAGAVAAFVVALVAITGIESIIGKPLAALIGNEKGGGTTIGRSVGSEPAPATGEQDTPTPTPTSTAGSPTPSDSPTPTASSIPSGEPSSPVATEPTGQPTPQPTVTAPAPTLAPSP